jgi:hypothetical protein
MTGLVPERFRLRSHDPLQAAKAFGHRGTSQLDVWTKNSFSWAFPRTYLICVD